MKRELRELIVLLTDAYKLFHREMYPENTITVYSNGTPRSSRHYKGDKKDEVVVFGIQRLVRLLKDKFQEFFDLPEEEVISFCKEQLSSFTGTDYNVEHLVYLHRLQKLPLVVKSLPEGTKCPIKVPYMTFYNTDPKCFWLTNYLETFISAEIWHFITNATIASEYNGIFTDWAIKTVGNSDFVQFQGHDFSARGDYGFAASTAVGLAHSSSFAGGDTVSAYLDAQYYYDAPQNDWKNFKITQTSVPASEHSVQCAYFNPKDGNELAYLDAMLDKFEHAPILSIVCDGYDFWKFITEIVPQRKDKIMVRAGKVVFRPDSGNIVDIICGTVNTVQSLNEISSDKNYSHLHIFGTFKIECPKRVAWKGKIFELTTIGDPKVFEVKVQEIVHTSEQKGAIEVLWDIFGGTETEKGYKLLDSHVGLIYGDSVTIPIASQVCQRLADKGFASINWVAGIGSYTYQFNTRDSHGQAIKATYVEFLPEEGKCSCGHTTECDCGQEPIGKAIFKDPKTGDGVKKSAKGLLRVSLTSEAQDTLEYELQDECTWEEENEGVLQIILRDGEFENQITLEQIRNTIKNNL